MATIGDNVERLGLDIGAAHDLPCQIFLGELGVGCLFRLLGDGVYALRSIVVVSKTDAVYENVSLHEVIRAGRARIVRLLEPIHGDMDSRKGVSVGRRMRLSG